MFPRWVALLALDATVVNVDARGRNLLDFGVELSAGVKELCESRLLLDSGRSVVRVTLSDIPAEDLQAGLGGEATDCRLGGVEIGLVLGLALADCTVDIDRIPPGFTGVTITGRGGALKEEAFGVMDGVASLIEGDPGPEGYIESI